MAFDNMTPESGEHISVQWMRDFTYVVRPERALSADLVRPVDGRVVPVIIWLHGGGFRLGSRKLAPNLTRYFAERGFAMLSIDYRLSQEAPFPAALEDVLAAISWIAGPGAALGLDSTRIGLWGSSAGGYLASMVASAGGRAMYGGIGEARIGAAVIGYAPVDFATMVEQHKVRTEAEPSSVETGKPQEIAREAAFLGGDPKSLPERTKLACPLTHITGNEPPCLIMHGDQDVLVPSSQSEMLFESLAKAGAKAEYVLVHGVGHAFLADQLFARSGGWHVLRRQAIKGKILPAVPDELELSVLIGEFFLENLMLR